MSYCFEIIFHIVNMKNEYFSYSYCSNMQNLHCAKIYYYLQVIHANFSLIAKNLDYSLKI